MAEHWKSTPRYWCKHCSAYVRDTKLERQNHEATARHQGAVKRSLRELHRGKEAEDREKERARREVERLNGVVSSGGPSSSSSSSRLNSNSASAAAAAAASRGGNGVLSESERKRQAEQLALMGVSIPQEFRGDLAMAGEWTVTATTVVEERPGGEDDGPGARARGVHKRERTEEEQEEEKAVKSLFKKPRRWGRDARAVPGDEDLDALLSGGLLVKKTDDKSEAEDVKKEDVQDGEEIPAETSPDGPVVKKEEEAEEKELPPVKKEDDAKQERDASGGDVPVVAFKKRKPKNIRQK